MSHSKRNYDKKEYKRKHKHTNESFSDDDDDDRRLKKSTLQASYNKHSSDYEGEEQDYSEQLDKERSRQQKEEKEKKYYSDDARSEKNEEYFQEENLNKRKDQKYQREKYISRITNDEDDRKNKKTYYSEKNSRMTDDDDEEDSRDRKNEKSSYSEKNSRITDDKDKGDRRDKNKKKSNYSEKNSKITDEEDRSDRKNKKSNYSEKVSRIADDEDDRRDRKNKNSNYSEKDSRIADDEDDRRYRKNKNSNYSEKDSRIADDEDDRRYRKNKNSNYSEKNSRITDGEDDRRDRKKNKKYNYSQKSSRITDDDDDNDDRRGRNYSQKNSEEGQEHLIYNREKRKKHDYDARREETNFQEAKEKSPEKEKLDDIEPLSKRQKIGNINMRTGGAYIPPARLRLMQEQIKDKSSEEFQRIAWEALKKSIIGMTNKVNNSNITEIIPELLKENIIRGRGVLARAIMQAQAASPTFTRVYAALVAVINTKFPEIGELILKRLIIQYKRGFRRNDKTVCMSAARFLAHLLNQEVAHEVLILEMVTHLLENYTEDSVEVAIACLKECGKKLKQLTSRGMRGISQRIRDILHEGKIDVRVRYMIEVFFAIEKDGYKDFEVIPPELDLVEDEDKYTHLLNLDDAVDGQEMLNVFKFDPEYLDNEEKYKSVVKEILGSDDEEGSGNESGSEADEEDDEEKTEENQEIIDMTETNTVCLRRKIYLTVQSSLDFEECAHKLLKLELKPGQILEMCYMILDCCAQQRTYEKFFGLLAQRFCQLSKVYVEPFTEIFENSYKTIHRLETNKLRNVAKFFAHLLYTDAISWMVLANIKLNEDDTTSSSRIFIKILFQELCEYMGLSKLNERVKDVTLQEAFEGLFPRDHPHNARFAINFFTSIGLGGLTDDLREHLKTMAKTPAPVPQTEESPPEETSSSSTTSSSSSHISSTSSSSTTDSEEERIEEERRRRIEAKRQLKKKKK